MKHIKWFWIWIAFIAPFALDQSLKSLTHSLQGEPITFGKILGVFSSFSRLDILQITLIPTHKIESIVFIVLGILMIQVLTLLNISFVKANIQLRVSFSVVMGGFFSFVIDHILFSQTINNLALIVSDYKFYPFNLAILFTFIGLTVFIYSLITYQSTVFQKESVRKNFLLNNKNQNQFLITAILGFTVIYFVIAFLFGFYFKSSLSTASTDFNLVSDLMTFFYILTFLTYLLCSISVLILAILFSHRIYGPVYGFQNYMRSLLFEEGKTHSFTTRKKDHFKELEKTAEYVRTRLFRKL